MIINNKFTSILFIIFVLTFSSCKKEPGCMDPNAFNYNPDAQVDDDSCIPVILGCLETNAINFNSNANVSDESCIHAFDLAQGTWNIDSECDEIDIPLLGTISLDEQFPETIEVLSDDNNVLFIEINEISITGEIDNLGNVTVEEQTVSVDFGLGIPTNVEIEGSGLLSVDNTGTMNLTYSFEIPLAGTQSIECFIEMSK